MIQQDIYFTQLYKRTKENKYIYAVMGVMVKRKNITKQAIFEETGSKAKPYIFQAVDDMYTFGLMDYDLSGRTKLYRLSPFGKAYVTHAMKLNMKTK